MRTVHSPLRSRRISRPSCGVYRAQAAGRVAQVHQHGHLVEEVPMLGHECLQAELWHLRIVAVGATRSSISRALVVGAPSGRATDATSGETPHHSTGLGAPGCLEAVLPGGCPLPSSEGRSSGGDDRPHLLPSPLCGSVRTRAKF